MDMQVTVVSERGVPLMCEIEGCGQLAASVWSGGWDAKPRRCCSAHNPMANVAMPLPSGYTSHSLCHACGQPVPVVIHGAG
jgi:hypothetical protein